MTTTCPVETCASGCRRSRRPAGSCRRVRQRASATALTTLALEPGGGPGHGRYAKRLSSGSIGPSFKALKAAVKARKHVKLTVTVLASDVAGNSVTRTQSVKVKR